jgi:small subunit ribosomal protein S17
MVKMRNIGLEVKLPKQSCDDSRCPFHGVLGVRGRVFDGVVISNKSKGTIVVRRDYLQYIQKYLRYERRHSHISAHSPPCINAKAGDKVKIAECRPLSKTISFVVIEKLEGA